MYYEEELEKVEENIEKCKAKEYRFLGTAFVIIHDSLPLK